MKSKNLRSRLR